MKSNSAAQKAHDKDFLKNHLLVVKPNTQEATAKVINFQANAEDTASESIPQEVKAPEATTEPTPAPVNTQSFVLLFFEYI